MDGAAGYYSPRSGAEWDDREGLRRWQATGGVATTYLLDLQPQLATAPHERTGNEARRHGLGML